VQIDTDLRLNKPEIRMDVDRERAADMGVSVDAIARTVETMLGGRIVTRYKRDGEQYDVVVQTVSGNRSTPEDIDRLFVRGRGDAMIPLASLVKISEVVVPRELNHFGQRRSASITANLAPDYSLGEALHVHGHERRREVLPAGYTTDLNGQSREFRNASGSLAHRLRALAAVHLPGARGAVRELRRSASSSCFQRAAVHAGRACWRSS
jgi:multidrug efflux pump